MAFQESAAFKASAVGINERNLQYLSQISLSGAVLGVPLSGLGERQDVDVILLTEAGYCSMY